MNINEDSTLIRAIEILKVMYPNNSDVTNAISFKPVEERDHWLYDIYNYFEDITNKIYLEPEYTSEYIWLNNLDRMPPHYFIIPYNYFSMSDDEIRNDYKKRKEIAERKRYEKRIEDNFDECRILKSIPINYIKFWGIENKYDEIINTLINDWNNYNFEIRDWDNYNFK